MLRWHESGLVMRTLDDVVDINCRSCVLIKQLGGILHLVPEYSNPFDVLHEIVGQLVLHVSWKTFGFRNGDLKCARRHRLRS